MIDFRKLFEIPDEVSDEEVKELCEYYSLVRWFEEEDKKLLQSLFVPYWEQLEKQFMGEDENE